MHWDPFSGEFAPAPPPPAPTEGLPKAKRGGLSNIGALIAMGGFVVMLVEWLAFPDLVIKDFPVIGAGVATLGFVMVFAFGSETSDRSVLDPSLAQIARANGWSFKPIKQWSRRSGATGGVSKDPLMEPAYAAIGPLILPRFGDLVPVNPQALFWGQIDGRDMWLGVQQMDALNLPGQTFKDSMATMASGTGAVHAYLIGLRLSSPVPAEAMVQTIAPQQQFGEAGMLDDTLKLAVAGGTEDSAVHALRAMLDGAATAKIRDLYERCDARVTLRQDAVFVALKDKAHQQSGGDLPSRVRAMVQECAALAEALETP